MSVNSFDNYYMSWKPSLSASDKPLYLELAHQLKLDIEQGTLLPGTKLPPQRELADFLDINLSTVTRAFKLCSQDGLIAASKGNGTYVSQDVIYQNNMLLLNSKEDKMIEMGAILPSKEMNKYAIDVIEAATKEPGSLHLLQYNSAISNTWQHMMGVKWLSKVGLHADPDDILFSGGGQNAIFAILTGLFHFGDKIGCNETTYPGLKSAAKLSGILLVPIVDFSEASLDSVCKQNNLKGLYLIPDFHNPTTHVMSTDTRKVIANAAIKNNLIIIEDGINSLLREEALLPIAGYCPNHAIYIASLSKSLAPGFRLAFVLAPRQYQESISFALYNMNISVSNLLAQTAANLIQSGKSELILTERKKQIMERNQLVDQYLSDYELKGERTCPFRWLILPKPYTSHFFEQLAKAAKVQVYAADRFLVGTGLREEAVRLSVISEEDTDTFIKGLQILDHLLKPDPEGNKGERNLL